jgi:hypothetical protein
LPDCPRFVRAITIVCVSAAAGYGQVIPPAPSIPQQPAGIWQDVLRNCPLLQSLVSFFEPPPIQWMPVMEDVPEFEPAPLQATFVPPCPVAPLDPIADPAAQQLEASVGPGGAIDIDGMVPAAAHALSRFEEKVESAGGTIVLKSAYRPSSYQRHLQNVWHKWMDDLRFNDDPSCQDLRAQVQDEFGGHHLIETQHPVAVSDHTRGLAFDATVILPPKARIGRRRMTLDGLARLSGLTRPAIVADPVHFKYLGATVRRRPLA